MLKNNPFVPSRKTMWPWLAILGILLVGIYQIRTQGRLWICECGQIYLWVGDVWSSDNSQHWFDPYAFSHLLHGVIFFWVMAWLLPKVPLMWRLCIAIAIESLWEVVENSALIINRYRESTAALGYNGDTVVNSVGDILICGVGFIIAFYLGFKRSLLLFVVVEVVLLFWIRDNLTLNVIMLIYPIEAIKNWQVG